MYPNNELVIFQQATGPPSQIPSQNLRDLGNISKVRQNKSSSVQYLKEAYKDAGKGPFQSKPFYDSKYHMLL